MKYLYKSYTDVGGRKNNEDAFLTIEKDGAYLFLVADGLGGHEGSEMASSVALSVMKECFLENPHSFDLESSIVLANSEIIKLQKDTDKKMQTTVVAVYSSKDKIEVANVGDSRAYLFKDSLIRFQTMDHSIAQMAVNVGEIDKSRIRNHLERNILVRALGASEKVKVDTTTFSVSDFDHILLCSDGFWEYVLETDMENTLSSSENYSKWLENMRDILINNAVKNNDNNTAIVIKKEGNSSMKYCDKCMSKIEDNDRICTVCGADTESDVPSHHLRPGTMLNSKFVVGKALGAGGFGITYIGRDTNLDMKVAIKEYYPNGIVNRNNTASANVLSISSEDGSESYKKGKERFLKEARILAKFSGSLGIVDVRDFFEENNTAYIVMEYLEGMTLKEYLNTNGTLTVAQTLTLFEPVMRSLKKVHSNGLIHRDISPDNIMLVDGRVKLLDFGAARDVSSMNNKSLSVMLKPGYAPEEQYRSKGNQGPWTDVYALCATMYKCITGVTLDDAPQRVFDDEVKLPSQLGVSIESEVENALVKGIAVLQKDRYQNIDELLNALKIGEKSSVVPTPDSSSKKVAADNLDTDYRTYDGSGADYSNRDDVTLDESEIKSTVEEDIPVYSGFASSDVPVYNTSFNQKASDNQAFSVNKAAENDAFNKVNKPSRPKKEKNKKSKKSIGMIAMISVLIVVALVVVITVFSALGNVTIGDKKYSKNEERVRISNATLSEDDVKNICSMGKMEVLEIYDCKFEKDTFSKLCEISSPLTGIYFYRCTGIEDYSTLTNLEYIQSLTIDACMITDEQLKKIDFSKFEYLMGVNLSNNIELSDISPLAKMNTLTTLNVTTTKVRDFSSIKDIEVFNALTADNCGIENIDTLQNKNIVTLCLNNNKLTDISAVERFDILSTFEIHNNDVSDISALKDKAALGYFEAGFNNISDISPLKSSEAMYSLVLNDNNITDISAVSSMQTLFELNINNNQVESLKPLENAKKLGLLFANENKLSDLDGLEQSIELSRIRVRDNNIENINGIGNCTVLKEVNLKNNNISDISLLSKNAEKLQMVFIDNNNVSDISALNGTVNLEYFSFDNNKVKNLDALSSSTNLYAISGENNELTSIDGLKNSTQIVYVFLPHNKIGSMKALSNLGEKENLNGAFIDLSTNNISELDVCNTRTYNYLAVYSNPIKDISPINNAEGNYFLFNYLDDMNLGGFEETFSFYNVIDCPLDKQLEVTEKIKGEDGVETLSFDVLFNTAEEADATIREQRNKIFGISDEKDEIKKTQETKE